MSGLGTINSVASMVRLVLAVWLFARMLPLTRALFAESSPGPAKRAAQLRGLCGGGLRLPSVRRAAM